ncbi:hypothetical protein ABZ572_04670 [Streptomyces sp. NPDC018338]|uniref:hypothetical protein n=1 Tax=Streptomyces sp. NPDC018338 TaxID=3157192 RepID=UPI0033C8DF4E
MSQEERDARLGLTGLTGAEREARLRLLKEEIEREAAAARAALQAQRAARRAQRDAESDSDPDEGDSVQYSDGDPGIEGVTAQPGAAAGNGSVHVTW